MADRQQQDSRNRRLGLLQAALVLLLVGGAFLIARRLAGRQISPTPAGDADRHEFVVETLRVESGEQRLRFATTGTIQVRTYTALVPQVSGRVVRVGAQAYPGGQFKAGDLLFEIEPKDYELRVEQLRAEVAGARTKLQLQQASTKAAVAEWQRLNPDREVPPLVAEQPQLDQTEAALDAAQARLETARLDLDRTRYRAPFAGRIVQLDLEVGQNLVAGQPYGQAYSLEALEVDVPLTEEQLGWVREAREPTFRVVRWVEPERTYAATLRRFASTVAPRTRLTSVYLGFAEPPGAIDLAPGAFVRVQVGGPRRANVWALPIAALQEDDHIWTVTADDTLRSRQPTVLARTADTVLAESDGSTLKVVLGSLKDATEGTPVRLVGENGKQTNRSAKGQRDKDRQPGVDGDG